MVPAIDKNVEMAIKIRGRYEWFFGEFVGWSSSDSRELFEFVAVTYQD
jgi:hypothetical protein